MSRVEKGKWEKAEGRRGGGEEERQRDHGEKGGGEGNAETERI